MRFRDVHHMLEWAFREQARVVVDSPGWSLMRAGRGPAGVSDGMSAQDRHDQAVTIVGRVNALPPRQAAVIHGMHGAPNRHLAGALSVELHRDGLGRGRSRVVVELCIAHWLRMPGMTLRRIAEAAGCAPSTAGEIRAEIGQALEADLLRGYAVLEEQCRDMLPAMAA